MEYEYAQAIEILRRTPATLAALLRGLPEAWTTSTEGPGTWSAQEIVGHLLHGDETDWIARAPHPRGGRTPPLRHLQSDSHVRAISGCLA
jgi:DinB family protein